MVEKGRTMQIALKRFSYVIEFLSPGSAKIFVIKKLPIVIRKISIVCRFKLNASQLLDVRYTNGVAIKHGVRYLRNTCHNNQNTFTIRNVT
jgi:hypothetical protein